MKYIAICLIIALPHFSSILLNSIAPISKKLQSSCNSVINTEIVYPELIAAFVCGVDLSSPSRKLLWIQSGLYHLLVVSGSHLIFLTEVLTWFETRYKENHSSQSTLLFIIISSSVLIFYCLMSGFQAPIARALALRFTSFLSQELRLAWPSHLQITAAGTLCLLLFPQWINSSSLLLSWLASLAISQARSAVGKSWLVYFFVLPCLWGWGQLHPLTVLFNIILAPPVSVMILLASVAGFAANLGQHILLVKISGELLLSTQNLLKFATEICPRSDTTLQLHIFWSWTALVILTAATHQYSLYLKRFKCAGSSF